jgi:hypothetical protein
MSTCAGQPSRAGAFRATTYPINAAAPTISGNGSARKKMPTKAKPDNAISSSVFSARLPMRQSASITITSTAALMPNSAPSIAATPRPSA